MSDNYPTTLDDVWMIEDGAKFEHEGAVYRIRIEPDEDYTVFDSGDWYGKLEWGNDRPDGFDGRARKLSRYMNRVSYDLWWQPPADVEDDRLDDYIQTLVDLIEHGYNSIGVEKLEKCDLGHLHNANEAWLGGVEATADRDYLQEIISDLLYELKEEA